MPVSGIVEQIAISPDPDGVPAPIERVRARAGRGLEGEHHFSDDPEAGQPLTLIAAEALDGLRADTGIELSHEESRRNVLTRGIDLNVLVGRRFSVGEVECEGIELCEPCNHLAGLTERGVLRGLVHRGGLRADILSDGEIAAGDTVRAG
jgi:MOSC domain-containing protein YiiM